MSESDTAKLSGGELNAAVTSALVGIHTRYLGRGPKSASTFHHGNVIVTIMHDVLTHPEKTLIDSDQSEAVHHFRRLLRDAMVGELRAAIERLTGRTVVAYVSGNDLQADAAGELFMLDEAP